MKPTERWLAAVWPVVRDRLPAPPARVVEIGCGSLGGFVPMLRSAGYDAIGVDPKAPEGDEFVRRDVERVELSGVDAVVASTSLHHVADPRDVIGRIARALTSGGTLVVIEWAWEAVDEPTARWCFERLGSDDEAAWLHRRRDEWAASGQSWEDYLRAWARENGLHRADVLLEALDERFERAEVTQGPYFFPELPGTSEEDERAAIDSGAIRATRVDYVARLRDASAR